MKRKDLVTAVENMDDIDRLKNIQNRLSSLGIYSEIQKEKNGKYKRAVLKVKPCDLDTASEVFKVFGFETLQTKSTKKSDGEADTTLIPSLGSRNIPDYELTGSSVDEIMSLADRLGADIADEHMDMDFKKEKSSGEQEFLTSNVNMLPIFHQTNSCDDLRSIQAHLNTHGIFTMIIKEQTKTGIVHSLVVSPKDIVMAVDLGEIFRQRQKLENAKLNDGLAVSPDANKVINNANQSEEEPTTKDENEVNPNLSSNLLNISEQMHDSLLSNMDKTKAEMDKKKEQQQKNNSDEQEEQMVLKNEDEED